MKVAVVHNYHSGGVPSGEDVVVDAEVRALRAAGVDVEIFAIRNDDQARRRFRGPRAAWSVATGRGNEPALDGSFDIVHVHNLFPYYGTNWLSRVEAPVVSTQHNYRAMCANGYLFRAGDVCTRCPDGDRWAGVRGRCYRGSMVATLPLSIAGRKGPAANPLIVQSDIVLVLSERSRELLLRGGVSDKKLVRDWHFLPDSLVEPLSGGAGDYWLFVGRVSPEKGIEQLISVWPDDVSLRVVGSGDSLPRVKAASIGKKIDFLGLLPRDKVLAEMRSALGLLAPSLQYETFGLVYLEALSAGLPVLAFRPNVLADAVVRDGTGMAINWPTLGSALSDASTLFPGLRRRCRDVFDEIYSEASFIHRRLDLYAEVSVA